MNKFVTAVAVLTLAGIGACSKQAAEPTEGTFIGLATVFKGDSPRNTLVLGMSHSLADCNEKVAGVMKREGEQIPEGFNVVSQCVEVKGERVEGHAVPAAPVGPEQ